MPLKNVIYRDRYICYAHDRIEKGGEKQACIQEIIQAHSLLMCAAGALEAKIEGSVYRVAPGDVLLNRNMESYYLRPPGVPCAFHYISSAPTISGS
jgi:hypothetical protein